MPMIARINTRRSPLLHQTQAYCAERCEWVVASQATIFAEEWQALAVIDRDDLIDVCIITDELLESLE